MIERIANGLRRHRLQPEPFHGVSVFRELTKIVEDQLAFPTGVASVDDLADVFARDQLFQRGEHAFRFVDWLQLELFRDDRQRLQPPETVFLFVDVLRHEQFRDVTDRRGDHVLVVLVVIACLGHFAEGASEIAGDAGLLRNDERLRHFVRGKTAGLLRLGWISSRRGG